jgi:hypothetical protein
MSEPITWSWELASVGEGLRIWGIEGRRLFRAFFDVEESRPIAANGRPGERLAL